MSDHYQTEIKIGGTLSRHLLHEFVGLLGDWSYEYGEAPGWEEQNIEDVAASHEPLVLRAEIPVGLEKELLAWCRVYGLLYRFDQDGRGEYNREVRNHSPEYDDEKLALVDAQGDATYTADQLRERASWGKTIEDVIAELAAIDDFKVPALILTD